jgi:hypothetical protein
MLDEILSSGSSFASQIGWCAPRKGYCHEPEQAQTFLARLPKRSAQDISRISLHTKTCLIYSKELHIHFISEIPGTLRMQTAHFEILRIKCERPFTILFGVR